MKATIPVIRWKRGSRCVLDALQAHQALEEIREAKGGTFTPDDVVSAAKAKEHILHDYFEWNDRVAGAKYRIEQAQYLIRSIEVTYQKQTEEGESITLNANAFQSLGVGLEDGKESRYHSAQQVLSSNDLHEQMSEKILMRLLSLRRKFSSWQEFKLVWTAIDELQEKLADIG